MSRNLAVFDYRPEGELYLGIDFGYKNPFACLWIQPIDRGERVLVLDEYYQRFRTTAENGRALLEMQLASGYGRITDAFADPSDPEKRAVLSEILGIEVKAPHRSVEVGQELVRRWLKVRPDGLPGLLIHHRCKELISELKGYMVHEPGKGRHHALDALRYFFAGWIGAD
ncbi:MAG: hypothetical protein ACP5PX_07975 [Candidatus Hadarchaeum sp.]|uniref:hypothetical protein n=1 Tax=Candidatus Hadarchaeum sp. TaxID=2883567 RepID=UPI003D100C36